MTSPRRVPIFDGHSDVLLRLYRRGGPDAPRAFLEGKAKGQLDLPMARQEVSPEGCSRSSFLQSQRATNGETSSQDINRAAPSPAVVEMTLAQMAVFSMVSLLLRIERESHGRVRVCRNVDDIQHWTTACWHLFFILKVPKQSTRISSFWTCCMKRDFALSDPFGAARMRSAMACRSSVPLRPTRDQV